MGIQEAFGFVHIHFKTHSFRNSTEIIKHSTKVFHGFIHDHNIVGKPKVSDVLVIFVDAKPVPVQNLEDILKCSVSKISKLY